MAVKLQQQYAPATKGCGHTAAAAGANDCCSEWRTATSPGGAWQLLLVAHGSISWWRTAAAPVAVALKLVSLPLFTLLACSDVIVFLVFLPPSYVSRCMEGSGIKRSAAASGGLQQLWVAAAAPGGPTSTWRPTPPADSNSSTWPPAAPPDALQQQLSGAQASAAAGGALEQHP
ncbi:unnamed protein product [Closterium sp. NIES-54]